MHRGTLQQRRIIFVRPVRYWEVQLDGSERLHRLRREWWIRQRGGGAERL